MTITNKQKAITGIASLNGFLWSWLFLIDDARLSDNNFIGYSVISLVFLMIVAIATTGFWLAISYLQKDIKRSKNWFILIKIFFVWCFVELAISWLVAVVWMGHNGTWTTTLPFTSMTPWLMWTPFGFISRLVGFSGVSAAFITLLFVLIHPKLRRYAALCLGAVSVLTVISWGFYRQANGPEAKITFVAEHLGDKYKVKPDGSQLVVLPEYGLDDYTNKNIASLFTTNKQVNFVGSRQIFNQKGYYNILTFGNNKAGFIKQEPKQRLVPGGEYLAWPVEIFLRAFANSTYLNFQVSRAVVKGNGNLQPYKFNDQLVVGAAACSSVISPEDYRSLVRQGSNLLTNSASLEIFRGSRLFNIQHRGMAKFMAVANARPLLQSSNNWPAFALDHNGRQIKQIQPVNTAKVAVQTNYKKTIYTYLGEWAAYIGGIWILIDLIKHFKNKQTKTSKSVKHRKTKS